MTEATAAKRAPEAAEFPEISILGSRVQLISVGQSVDRMERWIGEGGRNCHHIINTGFHGIWTGYQDPALRIVLNGADLWTPDGIAPIWVARLRGYRGIERCTGVEIMREFMRRANQRGYGSYFYGETESTLAALRTRLDTDFPGHRICGMYSPPFRRLTPDEDEEVIERINAARPDVLWVALGLPKQERWIYEHRHRLHVPVAIGVGAVLSFIAGTVDRCPEWIGRTGFEWVYRFIKEPRKLWRRDLIEGPRFVVSVALELARNRFGKGPKRLIWGF